MELLNPIKDAAEALSCRYKVATAYIVLEIHRPLELELGCLPFCLVQSKSHTEQVAQSRKVSIMTADGYHPSRNLENSLL
ncbi:hypothetical protein EVAR_101675_1, partial [Eumeta japonica]